MAYNEPLEAMLNESASARAKRLRAACPEAYALTANEAVRVDKISALLITFFANHPEYRQGERREGKANPVYHDVYNSDSIALILELFKLKRVSLDNAYSLAKRVLASEWFTIDSAITFDDEGNIDFSQHFAALTTNEGYKGIIDRATCQEFYSLWDSDSVYVYAEADALRQALSLTGYRLLIGNERETLSIIINLKEFSSVPFTAPAQAGYIAIKSTRESTALATIGRAALDAATYDETNEAHNLTAAIGTEIRLRGKLISKRAFVAVDKLQRQLLDKACKSGFVSPEIELTLDEFMQLRQLTDKKSAREQFKKAAEDYYEVSFEAVSDTGRVRIRPLDAQAILNYGKAVFSFSGKFFDAHRRNGSLEYIPEAYFALSGNNDVNTYSIGIYIYDYTRRNLGKPNENRIKVTTLLEVTSFPSADDIDSKYYRRQIIEPFFKALDKAATLGGFKYTLAQSGGGAALSDVKSVNAHYDYQLFTDCVIVIQWIKEPEYHTKLRNDKRNAAEAKALAEAAKVESNRVKVEAAAKRKASGGRKAKAKPVKNET